MKKVILTALALVAVISAQAQGRINFSSAANGVNAKFVTSGLDGDPLGVKSITVADATITADLFWTAGSTTVGVSAGQLTTQAGYNQAFSSVAAQAGYFSGGTKTVTGWVSGPIVGVVRVWDTAFGSFDVARFAPGAHWAETALFVITPTLSPTAAPALIGLGNPATYTLTYNPVPEPSSMALAGLVLRPC
jgi:hypothetical protein